MYVADTFKHLWYIQIRRILNIKALALFSTFCSSQSQMDFFIGTSIKIHFHSFLAWTVTWRHMLLKESIGTMNIEDAAFKTIWTIIGVATGTFIAGPILSCYFYRWAFVKNHPYKILVGNVKNKTQNPSENPPNVDQEAHANGAYTHENPAYEAHVHEDHAHEDQAHEDHTHEAQAHEAQAHKDHTHQVEIHEAHAHEAHNHEAHALEININEANAHPGHSYAGHTQEDHDSTGSKITNMEFYV